MAFENELLKYEYHDGINKLLKEVILTNFKYIQKNIDLQKKEISEQIVNLNNRLDRAREKYLQDRLDFDDYQIIKNESKQKIDNLEMALQNQKLSSQNTDIKVKLEQVLDILPNLSQLYIKGDNYTKSSILAEKLEFQETAFRTPKLNSALAQIVLISNQLQSKKKGKITPKSDFSRQVTSEGFEPPTDGAEIRYSIQLNYEAIFINDK